LGICYHTPPYLLSHTSLFAITHLPICYHTPPTLLPATHKAQLLIPNIASSINRCAFSPQDNWSTGRQSCSNLPDLYSTIVYRLSIKCGTILHVGRQQLQ